MNRQPRASLHPTSALWTRCLALVVCQVLIWQPLAASAAVIAQQPMFTVSSAPANVMLMVDDSSSMQGYRLPTPPTLTIPTGNVSVKYGAGMRTVGASSEFTLRAPAFNPLWYNPAIQYQPWNDDNKPMPAPGTSYPALADNFPNADIGGTSNVYNVAQLTQRDMRYRTPGQRDWISQARGTVGSDGTFAAYAPAVSRWRYEPNTPNTPRWERDLVPAGIALYATMPAEGAQGADLFTNPQTTTCSSGPPCIQFTPTFTDVCTQFQQVQTGTQCVQYQQVQQGTQSVCSQYQQQQIGTQSVCIAFTQVQTGQTCTQFDVVLVPDATEETGYRQELVCSAYTPTFTQVCSQYQDQPIFGPVCVAYVDVPFFVDVCVQTQPVFQNQCVTYTPQQTGQTCTAYDPNWTCPPQDVVVTADALTPARYHRYEGGNPSSPASYRIIEIDRARGWTGLGRNYGVPANRYDVIDAVTGLATTRPDCAAGSWCTFEEEAQNFANFYAYYKNRGSAAIAVTSQALASLTTTDQFLRIGFGRINYFRNGPQPWNVTDNNDRLPAQLSNLDGENNPPGAVQRGVREFAVGSQDRADLFNWLFSLNWVGSTPNREAIDAAGQYFARSDAAGPWADFPGTAAGRVPSDHLWCRRNYTLMPTDGEWTKVNPGTSPEPQPLITQGSPNRPGGGNVLTSDGVPGPVITGTDKVTGSPLSYQYNPGSAAEQSYATGSSAQPETLSDVIQYYWSHDLRDANNVPLRNSIDRLPATASRTGNPAFWQHMSTFIVGYGVSASMDNSLNRTAVATGNPVNWPDVGMEVCRITDTDPACTAGVPGNRINDTMRGTLMSRGDFYAAASPQQLRQSILAALQQILAENASGSALAVSSSSAAAGNLVIQAGFRTDVWDGSVRAVDSLELINFLQGGPQPTDRWQANFPLPIDRNIVTSTAFNSAVPFTWNAISGAQQTLLGATEVLDYLRGESVSELRFGGSFRDRRDSILGDIVNSSPLYSVNANWMYHLNPSAVRNAGPPPALPSTTYRAYVQSKKYDPANNTGRVPSVLVGANDGMVHAFDARATIHPIDVAAGYAPGKELFAYVPRGVYANLASLTSSTYAASHKYYVDGQVVEGDVHFGGGGSWRTVAVGSTGAGARNVFALDITNPKAFDASKVLWDITAVEEPDLGYVIGTGTIGSIRDQNAANTKGRWVFMTGNGYESANNRAVLLLFDMQSGSVIKRLDTLVGDATTPNGLGPATPVYDGGRNIVAAYAGDKLGNMWRFAMSDTNPANWTIRKVFQALDPLNNPQPITTAPRVVLHPLGGFYVLFGTGKFFESGDQADLQVQSVYGLWDRGGAGTIPKTGLGGLAQFTLSNAAPGLRQLDVSALNWSGNIGGWYFDLRVGAANGERIIASPIMVGGLLQVTSFAATSQGDPCIPGGISYIYRLDLASSFNQSVFLNQLPNVVGIQQSPGSVAGAGVFYLGANPGAMVASENEAQQATNLGSTGVAAAGDRASEAGTCTDVIAYSGVSGSLGGVRAVCQQYLPMRLFRPLR